MVICAQNGELYNCEGFESIRLMEDDDDQSDRGYYIVMQKTIAQQPVNITLGMYETEEAAAYDMEMITACFAQNIAVADIRKDETEDD